MNPESKKCYNLTAAKRGEPETESCDCANEQGMLWIPDSLSRHTKLQEEADGN
jgi:hypothetical protein